MARKTASSTTSPSSVFILAEDHQDDLIKIISIHTTHSAAQAASESIDKDTIISEHALHTAPTKTAASAPTKSKKPVAASTTAAADKSRSAAMHAADNGADLEVPDKPATDALNGRAVCFTGELVTMKRKEAQGLAEAAGAKVHGSITKTVNLVVLGKDAGPKKLEQIEKNGIEIIDEKTFLEWVKGGAGAAGAKRAAEEDEDDDDDDDDEEEKPKKKRARAAK